MKLVIENIQQLIWLKRQTNKQTNTQTNKQTHKQTHKQTNKQTKQKAGGSYHTNNTIIQGSLQTRSAQYPNQPSWHHLSQNQLPEFCMGFYKTINCEFFV